MKQFFLAAIICFSGMGVFAGPLKIDLQTPKEDFILYEALNLKYTLKNTSDKYLIIPVIENTFIFESEDGNQIRLPKVLPVFTIGGPCDRKLILKPHQSLEKVFCGRPFHGFTGTGNFKVIFEMDGTRYKCDYFDQYTEDNTIIWRGKLKTPPVEITISKPQGIDLKVLEEFSFEGLKAASYRDSLKDKVIKGYPQSKYALWLIVGGACISNDTHDCVPRAKRVGEHLYVEILINQYNRFLATRNTKETQQEIKRSKIKLSDLESVARYHQNDDLSIPLFYMLGIEYISPYNYKFNKAKTIFQKVTKMIEKREIDHEFKKSAKKILDALAQHGK